MKQPRVISAGDVAILLNCSEATFRAKRALLERDHNFPAKMPGCNGWSEPAVCRWIETNGETYLPEMKDDREVLARAADALGDEYAGRAA